MTERGQLEQLVAGERRVVTLLFCDVIGSTAMAEKLDPEEWARIIQRALKYLIGQVHRHAGTVAQVMGDGILAIFGAPAAHEDDPQRAVRAGLGIIEDIRVYHEQLQRERGLDFNVRVGIHTGLVVVGNVGEGQQVEYTAVGDTVNLAARMEQTARPGTAQTSAETYRLIEQMFECEPLGEIQVKGKSRPVRTYRVIGLKAQPGPQRGLEREGLHSPLVGREAEFAAVKECLDRLIKGQGGIVGIFGEAGVGKSRLIAEIKQDAPAERLHWLEGHTLSYGQTIPYWPFQEILRCYADITNNDSEDQAWRKLESKIADLFPENAVGTAPTVAEILPYLASLLAITVKGDFIERVKYLDGEALGKQIYLASRRFFERLARTRPVALVFEDLHWMDEASVGLLEHLLPLVESVPLMILGLSRPYRNTPAARLGEAIAKNHAADYIEIHLAPLSQDDSAQLVRNLLEIEDLPAPVRAMILSKAEGNPFFLEEILRALIDLGAIQRDPTSRRWRATAQIESLAIPDTVQGVILARLDRLEAGVKQVLRLASVIGRSFLYRVLRTIAEAGERLEARLSELQAIELIQEKQRLPELEYLFKHALAQEATYESILLQTRRELHGRVGQAMETLFADRLEEFYGLLAYHYARAEAWEKAQVYLLKAADQAGRMAADGEALAHYQQAKAAYGRAFGEQWDPVERAALERKMGEAFYRRGEHREAFDYLRRALAYLKRPFPTSRWAVRRMLLREIAQQFGRSLLPGLYHPREAGPAEEEVLRIYQSMQFVMGSGDQEAFLLLSFRMLNFCQQNSLPVGIARASTGFGMAFSFLNLSGLAEHYNQQALRLAEQLQRPDALGFAHTGLMLQEGLRGKWEAAFEHGRRAVEALWKTGNLLEWSISIVYAGNLSIWRGDFARALAYGQQLAQSGLDAGDRASRDAGLTVLGLAEQRIGRLEEAILHLKQAIDLAEAIPIFFARVDAGNALGQCYLRQGQWQNALNTMEANQRFIVEHNMRRNPFRNSILSNNLAAAYLQAVEQSNLVDKDAWLKKAGGTCRAALKWGKTFRQGKSEAMRLQGRYEWLKGNTAQAQRWWQKSLAEAETLGMPYELGLTHWEIGRRLGERAHLEKAEAIFAKIGAELDLAQARELLRSL